MIFFLALFSLQTSFAQSKKKKKNAYLKLELEKRTESYDSLKYVFYVDLYEFEDGIKKTCRNLLTTSSMSENEVARWESDIKGYQSKLMRLKERFSSLKEFELPEAKINPHLEKNLNLFDPVYVEIERKSLPDKRLKIQNAFLEERIHAYDSIFRLNEQTIRNMHLFKQGLLLIYPTLLEKQQLYDEYITYLKKENTNLINQLNKLYDEDLKKGSKNSPDVYSDVFPKGRIPNNSIVKYEESYSYCMIKEDADFPGGLQNLKYYVRKNYHIPDIALEMGLEGKTWVRFTIQEDGSVSDVKVIKGITDCLECDREAIRVVRQMPHWRPAMMDGRAVKTMYRMPFEIRLN